ncbi:hypothetical protein GN244_ATG04629 [Phytophthora infestans]|uniref:Uncharacterized protein n=1 Tax=Phytophthora infestans TaxID=4787 RepID=A0A833TGY2_PHYIN|nr:hypothetical protein GN244_ATG04629 [Phytophthora infestans]KAF4130876.1 hypothetical protein GN958_ATG19881 [Phytophthora infestans]
MGVYRTATAAAPSAGRSLPQRHATDDNVGTTRITCATKGHGVCGSVDTWAVTKLILVSDAHLTAITHCDGRNSQNKADASASGFRLGTALPDDRKTGSCYGLAATFANSIGFASKGAERFPIASVRNLFAAEVNIAPY